MSFSDFLCLVYCRSGNWPRPRIPILEFFTLFPVPSSVVCADFLNTIALHHVMMFLCGILLDSWNLDEKANNSSVHSCNFFFLVLQDFNNLPM